jgi:hypothetical protein
MEEIEVSKQVKHKVRERQLILARTEEQPSLMSALRVAPGWRSGRTGGTTRWRFKVELMPK